MICADIVSHDLVITYYIITFIVSNSLLLQPLYNIFSIHAKYKSIVNYIHIIVLLNNLQHQIIQGVFDYIIHNKGKCCVIKEYLLLLNVRRERRIRESCMIHALEIGFILLNKKIELIILALTRCATKNIGRSTIYIVLSITIRKASSLYTNISVKYIY